LQAGHGECSVFGMRPCGFEWLGPSCLPNSRVIVTGCGLLHWGSKE